MEETGLILIQYSIEIYEYNLYKKFKYPSIYPHIAAFYQLALYDIRLKALIAFFTSNIFLKSTVKRGMKCQKLKQSNQKCFAPIVGLIKSIKIG